MENSEAQNGWTDHPCLDGRKPCRAAPVKHLQTNRDNAVDMNHRINFTPVNPRDWGSYQILTCPSVKKPATTEKADRDRRCEKAMAINEGQTRNVARPCDVACVLEFVQAFDAHPWGKTTISTGLHWVSSIFPTQSAKICLCNFVVHMIRATDNLPKSKHGWFKDEQRSKAICCPETGYPACPGWFTLESLLEVSLLDDWNASILYFNPNKSCKISIWGSIDFLGGAKTGSSLLCQESFLVVWYLASSLSSSHLEKPLQVQENPSHPESQSFFFGIQKNPPRGLLFWRIFSPLHRFIWIHSVVHMNQVPKLLPPQDDVPPMLHKLWIDGIWVISSNRLQTPHSCELDTGGMGDFPKQPGHPKHFWRSDLAEASV